MEEIKEIYKEKENLKIAKASALVVSEGYCEKTRVEEIIDFSNRCKFKNIGINSLFIKYSKAPITVFAVKDRVLAHNPLGAIYQAESYYKDKLFPKK